ncbi:NIPSNAP family protein [Luteolibacter algae]|uniref:NIPSNAP family protein n=1 Tax=Luteolibacter algae TaxID=454151 RepID=A0ABW5D9M2_9BACT
MSKLLKLIVSMVAVSSFSAASAEEPADGRVFELRTYQANPGKLDALLSRFRDHTCMLFEKHGMTNIGYWVPVQNPDNLLIYLLAHPDRESAAASWKAFVNDPKWKEVAAASQRDGKLVGKIDSVYLKATDFSKGFEQFSKGEGEHIFEMRTYTATPGNLHALLSRFRDHALKLFEKHDMLNAGYYSLLPDQAGADKTLLYFLGHGSVEGAGKSWDAFRQDETWVAAKKSSEEKAGGSLTADGGVQSLFLKATDFSPAK